MSYSLSFSYTQDGSNGQHGNMACTTAGTPCGNGNLTFNVANNQINSTGYTYGLQGNMTADGVHTYAYDAEGNLNSVDSGSTMKEVYNALGWRVEANASGSVVDYQHDAFGQEIGGTWTGGSNLFVYFRGGLMAQYWSGASFAHINGLGSTQQFTNWSGTSPVDTLFYPWGQPWVSGSGVEGLWAAFEDGNGWLLNEWQTDTRRYTEGASRWFTPDPLGGDVSNPQSLNRYAYVVNNPTSLTDPLDLQPVFPCNGTDEPGCCDPWADPPCGPPPLQGASVSTIPGAGYLAAPRAGAQAVGASRRRNRLHQAAVAGQLAPLATLASPGSSLGRQGEHIRVTSASAGQSGIRTLRKWGFQEGGPFLGALMSISSLGSP